MKGVTLKDNYRESIDKIIRFLNSSRKPLRTKKSNLKRTQPSRLRTVLPKIVVEMKVPLCCEVCEESVRDELTALEGVLEISVDIQTQKVIVVGEVEASILLNSVKKVKHRAEMWRN